MVCVGGVNKGVNRAVQNEMLLEVSLGSNRVNCFESAFESVCKIVLKTSREEEWWSSDWFFWSCSSQ